MIPARIIERKRDGETLQPDELKGFLSAYLAGDLLDYHMSAFLMAVYFRGLSADETDVLVQTMLGSGEKLDLSYLGAPRIDKHSTGGVGDKVSLVLAPVVAAAGVYVPMMSGRGLGHTSGTLDKLEAIPGFRTDLALEEFRRVLEDVGCAMIGPTAEIAPLDRRLYALRDVTGTVPALQLIAASIMSKKLAEGLTGLLLDVKVGAGAFIPEEDRARELAQTMVDLGARWEVPTVALLTAMDRPLGLAVGNGLETAEAIGCLKGNGPNDLTELVLRQAAEMICLADAGLQSREGRARAETALDSGSALERFARLVDAQGGDPRVVDRPELLLTAPHRVEVRADAAGFVNSVQPRPLGEGVVRLGGGRVFMNQDIDAGVGFQVGVRPGQEIEAGDLLGVVHARSSAEADLSSQILRASVVTSTNGSGLELLPLVVDRIVEAG